MAITKEQFELSDDDLKNIHAALAVVQARYFADDPDADPPSSLDVTFSFEPMFGRSIYLSLDGVSEIAVDATD